MASGLETEIRVLLVFVRQGVAGAEQQHLAGSEEEEALEAKAWQISWLQSSHLDKSMWGMKY